MADAPPLPDAPIAPAPDAPPSPDACLPAECPHVLDVDVKTVTVGGTITANGAIPAQSCSGDELRGEVFFYEVSGYGSFRLPIPCAAADQPFTFSGTLFAGVYRVQILGAGSALPPAGITVESELDLRAPRGDLAWDVASRRVGGTVTQNGQIPAQTCVPGVNRAQIHLRQPGGDLFTLFVPCDPPGTPFAFSGTVPPGVYDIAVLGENSTLPRTSHVVRTGFVVDRDVDDLALDVVTHHVSGTVTLNGAIPGDTTTCRSGRGLVSFGSSTETVTLPIACAPAGTAFTFAGEVFPGSYRVDVRGSESALPRVRYVAASGLLVDGPREGLALDVPLHPVAAVLTVGGAEPAACSGAGPRARVQFYQPSPEYIFDVDVPCGSGPLRAEAQVYPGSYNVWAQVGGAPWVLAGTVAVAGATEATLDAAPQGEVAISGRVTVNGAIPAAECTPGSARATVTLDELARDVSVKMEVPCGTAGEPLAFSGAAPPGSYRVSVKLAMDGLPGELYLAPAPLVVSGPVSGVTIDVPTRRVSGAIALDGAATGLCDSGPVAATVAYIEETTHITHAIPARCAAESGTIRYEGDVFPGTYTVAVSGVKSRLPTTQFRAASGLMMR